MHIVLVDNGRSERLGMADFWYSLKCIRCGACMNTCPVYRRSGGLSYGATYSGPIGVIIDPTFNLRKYSSLPFASTLNGSCTSVCPVQDQHPRADLQVAADHRRAAPAALRQAGSDADGGQGPEQSEALSGGGGGGRRRHRASAALHDVQPAQCHGAASAKCRTRRSHFRQWYLENTGQVVSSRDDILARCARTSRPRRTLPGVPMFERTEDRLSSASRSAGADGREVVRPPPKRPTLMCRARFPARPGDLLGDPGGRGQSSFDPRRQSHRFDDVDVGVVRAIYGVAENGSVWLTEAEFKVNALGFLRSTSSSCWTLPDRGNLHHAYRDRAFKTARYGVLITGPSATADIEGVLIHGAQGVRSLTVLPLPRPIGATGRSGA